MKYIKIKGTSLEVSNIVISEKASTSLITGKHSVILKSGYCSGHINICFDHADIYGEENVKSFSKAIDMKSRIREK